MPVVVKSTQTEVESRPLSPQIVIKAATQAQAEQIAIVQEHSWKAAYPSSVINALIGQVPLSKRTALWQQRIKQDSLTYVAYIGLTLVGVIYVTYPSYNPSQPTSEEPANKEPITGTHLRGEIEALYVLPQFWQQGVGRALMTHVEQCHKPITCWQLWVMADNLRAQQFYAGLGYRLDERNCNEDIANISYLKLGMIKSITPSQC